MGEGLQGESRYGRVPFGSCFRRAPYAHDPSRIDPHPPAPSQTGINRPQTPPSSSATSIADTTTSTKPSAALKSKPLYRLLDYLLPCLKKRDTNSFFALPVEDKFAPGYSQIIKQV